MLLRLAFIGIIYFNLSNAFAQRLIFRNYTVSDGMVTNPIRKIFQDSKGFIWICTWEGLSKYDGNKFTNYTTANGLSDNSVNDVYESGDGKLYVALNTGITDIIENDIVTKKAVFRNVVINSFFGSPTHRIFAITDTSGIWELNNGRLIKPSQEDANASYTRITSINDSLIAVSSPEIPLRIYNPEFKILAENKTSISVFEFIFQDSRKRIWAGTKTGLQLFSLLRNDKTILKPNTLPTLFKNNPSLIPASIIEEANGNIWIGTNENLINLKPTGIWSVYSAKDGLPSNQITCLFQDREKNIWIGTNLGLSKLSSQNHIHMYTTMNELKNNNVLKLFTNGNRNKIFIGIPQNQIQLFDTKQNKFLQDFDYTTEGLIHCNLPFFFFNTDLRVFSDAHFSLINRLKQLRADMFCGTVSKDRIAIGCGKGILIGDAGGIVFDNTLPFRIQALLFDDEKHLWIGTWENGLYRISSDGFKHHPFSIEDLSGYVTDKHIRSLYQDKKGNIWIGTRYKGVTELIKKGNSYTTRIFDQKNGLGSNFVKAINEDQSGNIWIGSYFGIDKLIMKGSDIKVFNYSRINNFFGIVNDIVSNENKEIWCATTEGFVHIIDQNLDTTSALPVYLSSVFLAGKRISSDKKAPLLSHSENVANFEFSAAGYINEKQIYYSYRLLGSADSNWSEPANLHAVSYASLQPGNYLFEVRTLGWNGKYGTPTRFGFTILSPFWETWWFFLLLSIVVISIFYLLYQYRIKQLLQIQLVRNRLASDLHDDIGSTLTNISILSELGKKSLQTGETGKFLQRITEEADNSSQALDDIIWSVNGRNDTMEETLVRMRRYAAELFDNSETNCHIDLEETVPGKKMEMEQRRDFYLIYKESLNNIY